MEDLVKQLLERAESLDKGFEELRAEMAEGFAGVNRKLELISAQLTPVQKSKE